MATDLRVAQSGVFTVTTAADVEATLCPTLRYVLHNLSGNPVYGSTDGSAVVADDTAAAHKFKILGATVGEQNAPLAICGVATLKLKTTGGDTVIEIAAIPPASPKSGV